MSRLRSLYPKSRGIPQVCDRKVFGGFKRVIRNGSCSRFAQEEHGPVKTINSFWMQWSDEGIITPIPPYPAERSNQADMLMKDAFVLKSRQPAFSRRKKNRKRLRLFGAARSGSISRLLAVADASGPLFHIHLSAGQATGCNNAAAPPNGLNETVLGMADCDYDVNWLGNGLIDKGIAHCFGTNATG